MTTNKINVDNLKRQAENLSNLMNLDMRIDNAYGKYRLVKHDDVNGLMPITGFAESKRVLSEMMFAIQNSVFAMRAEWAPDMHPDGESSSECPVCETPVLLGTSFR